MVYLFDEFLFYFIMDGDILQIFSASMGCLCIDPVHMCVGYEGVTCPLSGCKCLD